MNTIEQNIFDLIEISENTPIQKLTMKGFISRATSKEEERKAIRELIEDKYHFCKGQTLDKVILSTDEYKIFTVVGNDARYKKYPFRFMYINTDGKWAYGTTVSPSFETAMICALGTKNLKPHSGFEEFAIKMLEIKMEE